MGKETKEINGYKVCVDGSAYEICAPINRDVLFHGNCTPEMTPRQVYDRVFPRPVGDGKIIENVTLFFIGEDIGFGASSVFALSAVLDVCEYSLSQDGYQLTYKKTQAKLERNVRFWNRPRIIAADGFITLPDDVLYNIEVKAVITTKTSKYLAHDEKQLDAISAYLDGQGINWREM